MVTTTSLLVVDATSVLGLCVSVTVTRNFNVVPALGAVNVGCCAVVLDSVTDGPAVCAHESVSVWPSTCDDPDASSVTPLVPTETLWFVPELATGGVYSLTVTVVVFAVDVLPLVPVPVIGLWVST